MPEVEETKSEVLVEAEEAPATSAAEEKGRPSRDRKSVTKFTPATNVKEEKVIEIPEGKGTELGNIENVKRALDSLKSDDPLVKRIHTIIYGVANKKAVVKKIIRQFKGVPKDSEADFKAKFKSRLERCEVGKDLKPICQVFDLEVSGNKEELSDRIIEFLLKPESSGREYKGNVGKSSTKKAGAKRKKKSTKKKSAKGEGEKKPSGYMKFSMANRSKVKAKNPDATFGEVAKLLGAMWHKLSSEEKAEWTDKDVTAAAKSPKKTKPSKPSKPSKKAKQQSESEESEEGDEDAPLKKGLGEKVEAKIRAIVSGGDLESLSVKKVKLQLVAEFGQDLVDEKGADIKAFINKCVEEK